MQPIRHMAPWLLGATALLSISFAHCCDAADQLVPASEVREGPARHPGGIWKAVVPPASMKAEFDGYDPIGLATGALIKADCSLNWIDPDTGRLYCFSSATSQSYFQDWPKRNIARAARTWAQRVGGGS